jgi:hypothetical protein
MCFRRFRNWLRSRKEKSDFVCSDFCNLVIQTWLLFYSVLSIMKRHVPSLRNTKVYINCERGCIT